MPAMMLRPAAITAGGVSCSRKGSAAASAGTITCSRSSGSAPAGSAAWAAVAAAWPPPAGRHHPAWLSPGPGSIPVHSSPATSSKLHRAARFVASRPRKRSRPPLIWVIADSITSSPEVALPRGRPCRASSATSSASNRLARPPAACWRGSTPRLTYEYRVAGFTPSRSAASAAPISSATRPGLIVPAARPAAA